MKFAIYVNQDAALRAGNDRHGYFVVEIPAAELTPEERKSVAAQLTKPYDGEAKRLGADYDISRPYHLGWGASYSDILDGVADATPETARQVLARMCERHAGAKKAHEEQEARKRAEERAKYLAADPLGSDWLYQCGGPDTDWMVYQGYPGDAEMDALRAVAATEAQNRNVQRKAEEAARQSAEAQAQAEARDRMAAWVREHGSETARLRLEEDYDCWMSAFRKEYADTVAARATVGLEPAINLEGTDGYPVVEPRKCPTADEIKVLRAIRERAQADEAKPKVSLVYVRYDRDDDCDDDDVPEKQFRTEVMVEIDTGVGVEYRYYLTGLAE